MFHIEVEQRKKVSDNPETPKYQLTWRFKSSPRHHFTRPSQTLLNHEIHCIYSTFLVFQTSFRCLSLSLNVPFVEREWNADWCFLAKTRTPRFITRSQSHPRQPMKYAPTFVAATTTEQTTLKRFHSTLRAAKSDRLNRRYCSTWMQHPYPVKGLYHIGAGYPIVPNPHSTKRSVSIAEACANSSSMSE